MSPSVARPAVWVASGLISTVAVTAIGGGAVLVVQDENSHSDSFDGFGTFLGLSLGVLGIVLLTVAVTAAVLARRHPWGAGVMMCVFGVVVAGIGVLGLRSLGPSLSTPIVLGGLLVGGIGFGAALGASSETIDSPGGYPE